MLNSVKSLFPRWTAFQPLARRNLHASLIACEVKQGSHTVQGVDTVNQLQGKLRQCIDNLCTIEAGLPQMPQKAQACQSCSSEQYQDYYFGRIKEPPPEMCEHAIELCEYRNGELMRSQEQMLIFGDYSLAGALLHVVYYARLHKRIPHCEGIQNELSELASQKELVSAFHEEARARGLIEEEVCDCVHTLYDAVIECPRKPSTEIVVRAGKYTPNQVAALISILKVQGKWPVPLPWREEVSVS